MRGRIKLVIVMAIVAVSALAATVPAIASTSGNPAPGPSATVAPVPATIPAQNYVPRGLPVVTPFAGCRFSQTESFTFSRTLGQFITRVVPAIVCVRVVRGVRQIRVFDLVLQR